MGRLIDADKLKQHYSWWGGLIGDDYVSELVEQKKVFDTIVDVQPTVDAEPTEEQVNEWEWCHDCKEYDQNKHCCHRWTKVIRNTVNNLKTQGYEIVRHGYWIYKPKDAIEMMFTLPKCSECGHESSDALNYCPNCGAKMDEVDA